MLNRRRLIVGLPLLLFAGLAGLFLSRLGAGDPALVPSVLIGKTVPMWVIATSNIDQLAKGRIDLQAGEGDRPVNIGDYAWIGMNCLILKGVTIGEGAIIGAGSVVTRDVPPFCLAAGSPARVLRCLKPGETAQPADTH